MAEVIAVEPTITAPAANRRKVLVQEFFMSTLPGIRRNQRRCTAKKSRLALDERVIFSLSR
jgi:hypothetical protein